MYNVVNIIGDYMAKKVNYLNNKDILKQIHISKLTFCYVKDDQYGQHDIILEDVKKTANNI
mgnify:CR=1 FL=1